MSPMPRYNTVKTFFRNLLYLPGRVAKLEELTHSLLYMQTLEKSHPEVMERVAGRQAQLPRAFLNSLEARYYQRERPVNTFRNMQAQAIAALGKKMASSLSAEELVALFQEASRLAGDRKNAIFRDFIKCLHTFVLDDDILFSAFAEFTRLHGIWGAGFERTWAIYISALLRAGDTDRALAVLKKYSKVYALKNLEGALPAAHFAHRHGFTNKKIAASAFVVEEVEKNIALNLLPDLARRKNVAIVGSGPFELGKGRGEEIDAHDVVIRFNLSETRGHEADYGSKTDIWAVNAARAEYSRLGKASLIFLCETLDRHAYPGESIQNMAAAAKKNGCRLTSLTRAEYRALTGSMGCLNPTGGLITMGYVKQINPSLGPGDIYGFSHSQPEEAVDNFGAGPQSYYAFLNHESAKDPTVHVHDLKKERAAFRALFRDCPRKGGETLL